MILHFYFGDEVIVKVSVGLVLIKLLNVPKAEEMNTILRRRFVMLPSGKGNCLIHNRFHR